MDPITLGENVSYRVRLNLLVTVQWVEILKLYIYMEELKDLSLVLCLRSREEKKIKIIWKNKGQKHKKK